MRFEGSFFNQNVPVFSLGTLKSSPNYQTTVFPTLETGLPKLPSSAFSVVYWQSKRSVSSLGNLPQTEFCSQTEITLDNKGKPALIFTANRKEFWAWI